MSLVHTAAYGGCNAQRFCGNLNGAKQRSTSLALFNMSMPDGICVWVKHAKAIDGHKTVSSRKQSHNRKAPAFLLCCRMGSPGAGSQSGSRLCEHSFEIVQPHDQIAIPTKSLSHVILLLLLSANSWTRLRFWTSRVSHMSHGRATWISSNNY